MRSLACVLAAVAVVAACDPPRRWKVVDVDPGLVDVASDQMTVRNDVVGVGEFAAPATFVLVDATNRHTVDLDVSLGGDLIDAQGRVLGALRVDSLRVPAGSLRTFALVADDNRVHAGAVSARLRVTGATENSFPAALGVSNGHVFQQGDHVIVSATVDNHARGHIRAIVLAGFYDAAGRPMTRPFTVMDLDGGTSHNATFPGPPGSAKGYIFTGQTLY